MGAYLRGQIAEMAGISAETLRFYERSRLIPPPPRTEAGYRIYSEAVLARIEFIKNAKQSGFTLNEIRDMFRITESRSVGFEELTQAVDEKIKDIDTRIRNLETMKSSLLDFKGGGSQSAECPHIRAFLMNFQEE